MGTRIYSDLLTKLDAAGLAGPPVDAVNQAVAYALTKQYHKAVASLETARPLFRFYPRAQRQCGVGLTTYALGLVCDQHARWLVTQIDLLDPKKVGYRQQSLTLIAQLMNHSRTRENLKTFHRLDDLRRRLPEETERELTDRECCDILRRLDIQSLLEPLIKPLKDCIQACDEGDTRGMLDSAHKSLRYAVECHNAPGRAAGSTYLAIAKFNAGQIYNALRACDDAIAIHASSPHWEARYGQATAAYAAARICGHQEIAFARLAAERIRRALGAYRLSIVLLQPLTPLYTDLEALCNEIRIRRDAMADL